MPDDLLDALWHAERHGRDPALAALCGRAARALSGRGTVTTGDNVTWLRGTMHVGSVPDIVERLDECNPVTARPDYVVHLINEAADEIVTLRSAIDEVLRAFDGLKDARKGHRGE